ncbi:hypothetical protein ACIG47_21075 [Promicromonospora sp. NPDC052451]|uniref:hypothetical protein n=1 Tax=unclassified Promicromonospora TaxID=2647929 RepID=UPI0037C8FAE3
MDNSVKNDITARVEAAVASAIYDVALPIDTLGVTFHDATLDEVTEAYRADPDAVLAAADARFAAHMATVAAAASDEEAEGPMLRARAAMALKERLKAL